MLKILFLLFMTLFTIIYFIPSFIAIGRRHAHLLQITILNTFLGWSFIPWVAALIWATTNNIDKSTKTKAAWIIIAVIFCLLISPLFLYSAIPSRYKSSIMEETQYKNIIYTSQQGKVVKEETKTKHVEKN
jgi:hypothetical protein